MDKKEATIEKEPKLTSDCNHYWVIKPVSTRVSLGICKLCGLEREFGNYITDCVDLEKEDYLEWGGRPRRAKKNPDPIEEVFSELKGGGKNAVKAVASR